MLSALRACTPRLASLLVLALPRIAFAQETTRVSVDASGAEGNGTSSQPVLSSDGRFVAFASMATNLVPGDTNGVADVFVVDRATGAIERVSVDSSGAEGNGLSEWVDLSSDGRFVVFRSSASNLVAFDTNNAMDIFVHDRATGVTERVSVDSSGVEGNRDSTSASLSDDGTIVVFDSIANNLVAADRNATGDVFVHDRTTGVTERVSVDSSGGEANRGSGESVISGDGTTVAFMSDATNLDPSDKNNDSDVFIHDLASGRTRRVSVSPNGAEGDGMSFAPSISADGMIVAFASYATNFDPNDGNGLTDIFVRDRLNRTTTRVSVRTNGKESNGTSDDPYLSADGNIVAFRSDATNLVPNDTNSRLDIFVHDMALGVTARASVDSSGVEGNDFSDRPSVSADGLYVAFDITSTNLVASDTNGVMDAFLHEICLTDASWTNYGAGFPGTLGVPAFTARADPELGTTLTLDLGNSLGAA